MLIAHSPKPCTEVDGKARAWLVVHLAGHQTGEVLIDPRKMQYFLFTIKIADLPDVAFRGLYKNINI